MRTRKEQLSALRRDNHVRGAAGKKGSKSGPRSDPKSQPSARAHFGGLYTFRAYEVEACPAAGIQAVKSNREPVFLSNLQLLQR